jgi:hypothetical protein
MGGRKSPARISVTKLDAAKRQLETAISLWFSEGDEVSTHTLATSALKVLHDVGDKKGIKSWLIARPNAPPEWKKRSMAIQGFFKHAHKDSDDVLTYNAEVTEFYIFDAIHCFEELHGIPLPAIMRAFLLRFKLRHTEIFGDDITPRLPKGMNVRSLGRADFLKKVLPLLG